jgi:hypothetical protein
MVRSNRIHIRRRRLSLLAALWLAAPVTQAAPPVASFTNFPAYEQAQISPDGTKLAFTQRDNAREYLSVLSFPDLKLLMRKHLDDGVDIDRFYWASNSRLLIEPRRRIPALGVNSYVRTGEIVGVDADGSNPKVLFGFTNRGGAGVMANREFTEGFGDIIRMLPDEPDTVLIRVRSGNTEAGGHSTAYRMNVHNGKLRAVADLPLNDGEFLTDASGSVVLAAGRDGKGNTNIYHRANDKAEWRLRETFAFNQARLEPFFRDREPGRFLARRMADGFGSKIVSWDPESRSEKTVLELAEGVVTSLEIDHFASSVWAFRYTDHFPEYWYPDRAQPLAQLHQALRQSFRDASVEFTSQTRDGSLVVARVSSPAFRPDSSWWK